MFKNKRITIKYILVNLLLAVIYFVSAKLGLKLAFGNPSATVIWPPTGIALTALLIFGYKLWPGIFIGAFFANVTTAGTILTSIGIATGNTLEAFVGAYLVNRFANGKQAFDDIPNIIKFGVLAGIVATAISATIGVTSLALGGFVNLLDYGETWFTWWLGDLGGTVIFTPFLLLWITGSYKRITKLYLLRLALALIVVYFVCQAVFDHLFVFSSKHYPIEFILIPILLLIAIRLGHRAVATSMLLISGIATWFTLQGFGPFAIGDTTVSLLLLQSFIIVIALPKMMIASFQETAQSIDKAKTEFISIASHQLRAPLSSISWLIDSLSVRLVNGNLTHDEIKLLEELKLSTQKARESVENLLNIARINLKTSQMDKVKIDIKQALEDYIKIFSPYAESKKHKLAVETKAQNLPELVMDQNIFFNILQNLLSNAVNYSPENTQVEVVLEKDQDMIKISVTNHGQEIAKADQEKLFRKFYRGGAEGSKIEGSGLGLYIVKSFVEDMNGSVGFESTPTATSFWFKIPIQ